MTDNPKKKFPQCYVVSILLSLERGSFKPKLHTSQDLPPCNQARLKRLFILCNHETFFYCVINFCVTNSCNGFSLVNTCTASSNHRESWFKSKRYVSFVLVWDCFGVEFCFMFSETAFIYPLHILVFVKETI